MRIAVFASAFYPSLGGVEELVRELAHQYTSKGHECLVVTNRWPRDLPAVDCFEGLEVLRFPFRTPDGGLKARLTFPLTRTSVARSVADALRQRRIELVHVQCVGPNGYYAREAARTLGVPLVVTTQGEITMDAGRVYQRSRFANDSLRALCDDADAVTAVSRRTGADLVAQVGHDVDVRVIYNGTLVALFASAKAREHHRPYISAVGRLTPEKGFHLLIEAFGRSGVMTHDLLIGGSGPQETELRSLIKRRGLTGRVHLVGRLDRGEVASLHAGADVFVLSSLADEGFPLACVEGMASGRAVVATRSGGVPEVMIDGENGLLVDKGDVQQLATAIGRLCNDPDLRSRLGAAAAATATRFDWERLAGEYLDTFVGVLRQ